ncbi:MAG TPA: hypothetical protein PLT55_04150 [Acidimicrobiia bacterium]|nr:hypothetical protein [Acidimicrobiia bacterium]
MIELVLALGAAMVIGNTIAIVRRKQDKNLAQQSLQQSSRASRQTTSTLAKNQISQGKATLAVAPLGRSIIYIAVGLMVVIWAGATLLTS